jgi:tetrahedral aminopeptidase
LNEETVSTILQELSSAAGVSGAETEAVEVAFRYLFKYTADLKKDRFGNLLALVPGQASPAENKVTIAVVAHIDEIGALVTRIEPGGFLRFSPLGGLDARILYGQAVEIHANRKLKGVVGAVPPHFLNNDELKKTIPVEKLFIDLGLDEETVKKEINVGDCISFDQKPLILEGGKKLTGKALDNRSGVAALIVCAAELASLRHRADVCLITSLQEEVGLRGAVTSAYNLNPDLAVIVDVTQGDAPGLDDKNVYKIGGGPALGIGPNLHPVLGRRLQETAEKHFLPYQTEPLPGFSGTDAWAFQVSREGIPTALLSIPLRYMHTAVELVSIDDLMISGKLLSYFISSIDTSFMEDLKKC